jgi:hypothetical protein
MPPQHDLAGSWGPSTPLCSAQDDQRLTRRLFLYDLGVLDHGDAAALGQFAFERNRLAAVLSELVVHWLVFTYDEIGFAIADDPDRTAALDAFRSAGLAVLFANRIVIDVAHHVDHFAGHFFRSGCVVVLSLRHRQRRDRQSSDERRNNCNLHDGRSVVCWFEHESIWATWRVGQTQRQK